ALDGAGANVWAGGGGAASGPAAAAEAGGVVARPPLAARLVGGAFQEVSLSGTFGAADRIEDVAAIPRPADARAALVAFAARDRTNVKALAMHVDGATGATQTTPLPASGAGRGAAARIAFLSPTDGWLVTNAGWVFHYTDGTQLPRDTDPAFANLTTFRPN